MSIKDLEVSQQPMQVQLLRARMIEIEGKLKDGTPGIMDAMIDVHKNLQDHEELIQFLSDEDIATLHQAFEKYKQVTLVAKEAKKVGKNKKLTEADLKNL